MRIKKCSILVLAFLLLCSVCACGEAQESEVPVVEEAVHVATDGEEKQDQGMPNQEEGTSTSFSAEEMFYYREGYSPKAIAGFLFRDKDREKIYSLQSMSIELTNPDSFASMEKEGDAIKTATLKLPNGMDVKLEAEGVVQNEDGSLRLLPGGALYSLSEIEGLNLFEMYCRADSEDSFLWATASFGVNTKNLKEVSSHNELYYGVEQSSDVSELYPITIENNAQFGFFKIINDQEEDYSIYKIDIAATGEHHGVGEVALNTEFYGWLMEGGYYDTAREVFDLDEYIFDFYLLLKSDVKDHYDFDNCLVYGTENYVIGDLRDKAGNVKAKTEPLAIGDTLDVELDGVVFNVELPVLPRYCPENYFKASSTTVARSTGDMNVLVVPVRYPDQKDMAERDMDLLVKALGKAVTADGSTYDSASDGEYVTFSEYYNQASYGKLNITSYITDWYEISDGISEEWIDSDRTDTEAVKIQSWVNKNYADWKDILDADADGFYDAVIFVNASTSRQGGYNIISFGGAFQRTRGYGGFHKRTGQTAINAFVNINLDHFYKSFGMEESGISTNTLIHEFGHGLGLIDYYDVNGSGYDAVGGFDMQSANVGDWNPYSKFAVGWTNPTVLTADKIGEGITVQIEDFEATGDTLIIPTEASQMNDDGTFCPFNEYICVDLFSPTGLNERDAAAYGLTNAGVRMYHVDSRLCKIDLMRDWMVEGVTYDVLNTNAYSKGGKYHIQLLQSGGKNTFTNGNYRNVNNSDLFRAGDKFTLAAFSSAFADGRMNDGSDFPYEIKVVEVSENTATISVTPIK